MANKIIALAGPKQKTEDLLVYADVCLDAIPAMVKSQPVFSELTSSALLSADVEVGSVTDYIGQDPAPDSPDDFSHIEFYSDLTHTGNLKSKAYNDEQRKRAAFKLQKNINVTAVKQAVHNIFTWTPGERILNPEFGNKLRSYLYEGITPYNQEQIMAEIRHCFTMWEPRAQLIKVINLTDVNDREDNTVRMDIVYAIPSLTDEQFAYRYEGQRRE